MRGSTHTSTGRSSWPLSTLLQQVVSLGLGLGVVPAFVLAWYHGEKGRQRVCVAEVCILAVTLAGSAVVFWSFFGSSSGG